MPTESASCGAVVRGLGGSEENRLELDVHRFNGGKCDAELVYSSPVACSLTLDVNGRAQKLELPATEGFGSVPLTLKLHTGCNKVRFINAQTEIPALIDCIRIK